MRKTISGRNCWFVPSDNYESDARGQYIPGRRIEIRFTSAGANYLVSLQPGSGAEWQGTYTVGRNTQHVVAKLYEAEDGSKVLLGTWPEAGASYVWLVRFEPDEDDDSDDGGVKR